MFDHWIEKYNDMFYAWHTVAMFNLGAVKEIDARALLKVINLLRESMKDAKPPKYEHIPFKLAEVQVEICKKRGKEFRMTYELYPEMKAEIDNLITVHAFGRLGDTKRAEEYLHRLHHEALAHEQYASRRQFLA